VHERCRAAKDAAMNITPIVTNVPAAAGSGGSTAKWAILPSDYGMFRWYAAYTKSNHERRVAEQLLRNGVEHFLPLRPTVRRWKSRRVTLERPLFPGYVFVRLALPCALRVHQIPGFVRLVGFGGSPVALKDEEIVALRTSFKNGMKAEPHAYLTAGRPVRIKCGPMAGIEGILVKRKNKHRFVVSLELICRSMSFEIEEADLEPRNELPIPSEPERLQ
jgi:transcription antitermination factor NusG